MTKYEILERIKCYNKTMLKLKLEELNNEKEFNFDRQNAKAEQISIAKDCEKEEIKRDLLKYFEGVDVWYNDKRKEDLSITELIELVNNFKK